MEDYALTEEDGAAKLKGIGIFLLNLAADAMVKLLGVSLLPQVVDMPLHLDSTLGVNEFWREQVVLRLERAKF
uniref:Uncharacterized protein n=1 Tax=Cyanothece sp. (strain PCC 7425 / ATCC 29141) TaxID=395961 RepID=B8HVV5_CYAP4